MSTQLTRERSAAIADTLKALAEPGRLSIISMIAADPRGEVNVADVTASLDLTQPTVSHHLKVLFEAELLNRRQKGTSVYYSVAPTTLTDLAEQLTELASGPRPEADDQWRELSHHLELASQDTVDSVLRRGVADLSHRFSGIFTRETVDRYVHESFQTLYRTARIKTFVPVFAVRFAQQRLTALAQAHGHIAKGVPEILFVCTQNAGRSQMAAALLSDMAGDKVHVRSAGSMPGSELHPTVVQALDLIGIGVADAFPKPLTDDVVQAADVVVTMGCGDACPIYPGKRYLDWDLADPADRPVEEVAEIRDQISRKLKGLLDELGIPVS